MKFSIIVACYNSEKTIVKCLDSIKNQSYKDFECILYDDGSNDSTFYILEKYVGSDKRFKLYHHTNCGTAKTTNDCIKLSSGDYIVPIDHDDWVELSYLEELNNIIDETNSDIVTVSCSFNPCVDIDWFIPWTNNNGNRLTNNNQKMKYEIAPHNSPMVGTHTQSCIRRSLFSNVLFDGVGAGADTVVMQILVHKAKIITRYNKVLYHRLVQSDSVSRREVGDEKFLTIISRTLKHIKHFYEPRVCNNPILGKYCKMYMACRSSLLKKHPLKVFLFIKYGWKIYRHRKLIFRKDENTIKNRLILLFPLLPFSYGTINKNHKFKKHVSYFDREDFFHRVVRKLNNFYINHKFTSDSFLCSFISNNLKKGEPFFISRLGATEGLVIFWYLKNQYKLAKTFPDWLRFSANNNTGFFPTDDLTLSKIAEEYLNSFRDIDLLAKWNVQSERFLIDFYSQNLTCIDFINLYPGINRWSRYLKGMRVLVVHPFADTIEKQYNSINKSKLFIDKTLLPDFRLLTYKPVVSFAGEKTHYNNWFEALDKMEKDIEMIKDQFDICLIACGGYGLPLGKRIYRMGKMVIHVGGSLQLLFGIKGMAYLNNKKTKHLINNFWVFPAKNETPNNSRLVENSCYWGK